jgi:hypothetical protein
MQEWRRASAIPSPPPPPPPCFHKRLLNRLKREPRLDDSPTERGACVFHACVQKEQVSRAAHKFFET